MSCVRPGVLLTKARRRRLASALIALDLPALERPTNAISGADAGGNSRGSCTEIRKAALPKSSTLKSFGFCPSPPFLPRGSRMRALTGFAAAMTLVYAGLAGAAESPGAAPKVDLERGKQLATTVCAACHGAEGVSTSPANPHLAGQHSEYIAAQLAAFKSGARPSPIMAGNAAGPRAPGKGRLPRGGRNPEDR